MIRDELQINLMGLGLGLGPGLVSDGGWARYRPCPTIFPGTAQVFIDPGGRPRPGGRTETGEGIWTSRARRSPASMASPASAASSASPASPHDGRPAGASGRPEVATARLLDASTVTPAGRYFYPPPSDAGRLPAVPASLFVVHLALEPGGFRIAGRPVPPSRLAAVIRACPEWRRRPLMVVSIDGGDGRAQLGMLLAALATALGVRVYGCDGEFYLGAGVLLTGGSFLCWVPSSRPGAAGQPSGVGRVLPVPHSHPRWKRATVAAPLRMKPAQPRIAPVVTSSTESAQVVDPARATLAARATSAARAADAEPARGRSPNTRDFARDIPPPTARLRQEPPGGTPAAVERATVERVTVERVTVERATEDPPRGAGSAGPRPAAHWRRVGRPADATDWDRLRQLLAGSYQAHAQVVAGMLALQPGLRSGTRNDNTGNDALAGLVAIRAHLSSTGPAVNSVLRGEPQAAPGGLGHGDQAGPTPDADAELLARCVVFGLRRLPAVTGPVYLPGTADPAVIEQYRVGTRLIEPGFAEARLTRNVTAASTVEYMILSATGKRTDPVAVPGRVLFSAGSQFLVLGVERPDDGGPVQVLLREVPGFARSEPKLDERALHRLRTIAQPAAVRAFDVADPGKWAFPLGIRADASPFAESNHHG